MTIFKIETFVNDKGQVIQAKLPVDDPVTMFVGSGALNIQQGGQVTQQVPFQFEIPGETIIEAFQNFDVAFESGRAKAEADVRKHIEAERRKILLAGAMNGHGRGVVG